MNCRLENKVSSLCIKEDAMTITNIKNKKSISLFGNNEFVLYIGKDSTIELSSSNMKLNNYQNDENKIVLEYTNDFLKVNVVYEAFKTVFKKHIELFSNKEIFIKRVLLECRTSDVALKQGKEGFPIFASDVAFLGIEFPAANNKAHLNQTSFIEAPFACLKEFISLDVAYGINYLSSLNETFFEYVKSFARNKGDKYNKVFCNWGAYDNLTPGDPILTEELALKNISSLKSFMDKSNATVDYYIMDAFWHKEGKKYQEYNKDIFPNGIDNVKDLLNRYGYKFGLWFDINFVHNKPTDFNDYDNLLNTNSYCFACDEVYKSMESAISRHIKEDGLKAIKLDFAYFDCKNEKHGHSIEYIESKEKGIKNFISMVNNLRKIDPELMIFCYNGWTVSLSCLSEIETDTDRVMSPYWLKYIDYIYCGDPRTSEIASADYAKSLIYYSDSTFRTFNESFIPKYAIDDHGSMIGNTGTIYYLGKRTFKESVLMNVMRGANKLSPYGDISLLDDEDAKYYTIIDSIFNDAKNNMMTSDYVLGDVRKHEVYGYNLHDAKHGYIVIINPLEERKTITLNTAKHTTIDLLIKDGMIINKKETINGESKLVLEPSEYLLLKYEGQKIELNVDHSVIALNKTLTTLTNNENLVIDATNKSSFTISYFDTSMKPIRTPNGLVSGLEIVDENNNPLKNNMPCNIVWSGVSWAVYDIKNIKSIHIRYKGEPVVISYSCK